LLSSVIAAFHGRGFLVEVEETISLRFCRTAFLSASFLAPFNGPLHFERASPPPFVLPKQPTAEHFFRRAHVSVVFPSTSTAPNRTVLTGPRNPIGIHRCPVFFLIDPRPSLSDSYSVFLGSDVVDASLIVPVFLRPRMIS